MRTFAQKPLANSKAPTATCATSDGALVRQDRTANPIQHLQDATGNQALLRPLKTNAAAAKGETTTGPHLAGFNFGRISVHAPAPGGLQTKLELAAPGDVYEQDADRVAEQVMRMPEPASWHPLESEYPKPAGGQNRSVRVQTKSVQANKAGAAAAPPIVHDVLRSPGQPLDATTRAFMEPRFGHDFGHVRVHTDARAVESAFSINSRAYTTGPHIAFGAQQYDPGTHGGLQLIAHELAHVVQQQSSGLGTVQRKPLSYGSTGIPITPPAKPFTLQNAKDFVTQRTKETPPGLTSGDVKGAAPGTDAEIFLWFTLAAVARPSMWGTENDLVVPIGWPPGAAATPARPGSTTQPNPTSTTPAATGSAQTAAAPTAAVTVRIDENGVGIAELISSQPITVAKTFANVDDAKTGLVARFGLKSVVPGDKNWTPDELNIVSAAFDLLPSSDRAAIKDVSLKRVRVIDAKHSAEFSTQTATLEVGNSTFDFDAKLFVGGPVVLPRSVQTIVHEVGHAVASKAERDAEFARTTAVAAESKVRETAIMAADTANTAINAYDALFDETNKIKADLNAALSAKPPDAAKIASLKSDLGAKNAARDAKRREADKLTKDSDAENALLTQASAATATAAAAEEASRVPASAVQAGATRMKSLGTAAAAALRVARGQAQAYNAKDAGDSNAYRQTIEAVSTELATYTTAIESKTANVNTGDENLDKAIAKRDAEKQKLTAAAAANPALIHFAAVEAAQASWATAVKTQIRLSARTERVQRFVDFVNDNKITPFTPHAKKSWPHKPDEFFAEAYALWRTDPVFVETNYKLLFDWFKAGKYR